MTVPETVPAMTIVLGDAVARHLEQEGMSLATFARRLQLPVAQVQRLLDGATLHHDAQAIEAVAHELDLPADSLREYRLASVIESLLRHPARLDEMFLESLSPIERKLIVGAAFSHDPFGTAVWRLLHEHELTQQELAEGVGMPQPQLSRVMNGHEPYSPELIETIAQALDSPPETFVEYRVGLINEWLAAHPERIDELFDELKAAPDLEQYAAWTPLTLPNPKDVSFRTLVKSLLDIVGAEGPVMGARVYELRLAACGLEETKELRSLLNRASAAAARVGLIIDENETGEQTQKYRILRLPAQRSVVARTLGPRRLRHIPPRELEAVVRATAAWKRGESVARVQAAIMETYGLSRVSTKDVEHLNRCINNCMQGDR